MHYFHCNNKATERNEINEKKAIEKIEIKNHHGDE